MRVEEIMQHEVVTASPDMSLAEAREQMQQHRIRHLPVVEDGVLRGVVNIRDLLETRFQEVQMTVEDMQRYIHGVGYH